MGIERNYVCTACMFAIDDDDDEHQHDHFPAGMRTGFSMVIKATSTIITDACRKVRTPMAAIRFLFSERKCDSIIVG